MNSCLMNNFTSMTMIWWPLLVFPSKVQQQCFYPSKDQFAFQHFGYFNKVQWICGPTELVWLIDTSGKTAYCQRLLEKKFFYGSVVMLKSTFPAILKLKLLAFNDIHLPFYDVLIFKALISCNLKSVILTVCVSTTQEYQYRSKLYPLL